MKKALADALAARGYTDLTPVQEAVLAPDLVGADMLVSAQTGSGKTLAFGLAIAPTLLGDAETFAAAAAPLALVIAPTRELALQVRRELTWLYAGAGATLASTVGGMDMRDERRALGRGAHVVVATPGRLRDHIERGSIDLSALRAVVLDEADEMLDLGFREDLEFILGQAPADRQTLLFSATVPATIARLAESYQRDARRIATASAERQHADIEYQALDVSARDGENAIINVLRFHEAPNALVFCNTRAMVNRLTTRLSNRGFPVVALSGELSQDERTHALQAMRDGRARVCVATDVAARGIDLPNLDLVIHAELPTGSDTLLHRSGRTGRAGRKGISVLIVPPAARTKARRLLGWAKLQASWGPAPSADAVVEQDRERMLADPAWTEAVTEDEAPAVAQLLEAFAPEQLAAAYLRLVASRRSAPEDLSPVDAKGAPATRPAFGPSQWFALSGGHDRDLDPRRLLPVLCKAGGVTRDEIGAIRIRPEESFFEIRSDHADAFERSVGADLMVEGGLKMRRADGPPPGGPRRDAPRPAAPKEGPKSKPHRKGATVPVDWNDDRAPRKPQVREAQRRRAAQARAEGAEAAHGQAREQEEPRPRGGQARQAASGRLNHDRSACPDTDHAPRGPVARRRDDGTPIRRAARSVRSPAPDLRSAARSAASPRRIGSPARSAWSTLERGGDTFDAAVATAFVLKWWSRIRTAREATRRTRGSSSGSCAPSITGSTFKTARTRRCSTRCTSKGSFYSSRGQARRDDAGACLWRGHDRRSAFPRAHRPRGRAVVRRAADDSDADARRHPARRRHPAPHAGPCGRAVTGACTARRSIAAAGGGGPDDPAPPPMRSACAVAAGCRC